jgi:hypothetical protein
VTTGRPTQPASRDQADRHLAAVAAGITGRSPSAKAIGPPLTCLLSGRVWAVADGYIRTCWISILCHDYFHGRWATPAPDRIHGGSLARRSANG